MPDAPAIEVIRKFDASGLFEQTGYIAACVAQIACDDCEIDIFRKVFIHIIHHTLNSRFHPCRWVCVILLQKMKVEEYDFIQPLCAVERCIWIDADSISVESRAPAPDNAQQETIDGIAQLQILYHIDVVLQILFELAADIGACNIELPFPQHGFQLGIKICGQAIWYAVFIKPLKDGPFVVDVPMTNCVQRIKIAFA